MIQAVQIQNGLAAHVADLLLKSGILEEFQTNEYLSYFFKIFY